MTKVLALLSCLSLSTAFVPASLRQNPTTMRMADDEIFDQEAFIAEGRAMRLKHLEDQAMFALKIACENYGMLLFLRFGRWPLALMQNDRDERSYFDLVETIRSIRC